MRWFTFAAALLIASVASAQVTVKVTTAPVHKAEISPLQYGQFVEYLCDLVPAMWAEKLDDGDFDGLSPYKFAYIKETDFKEHPWYPSGATNRATYTIDEGAQKIEATGESPCVAGTSQDGVAYKAKETLVFTCWLRAAAAGGKVRVSLGNATRDFEPTKEWKKFSGTLTLSKSADAATLSIQFTGPAALWIDHVSLMPEKTVGGWRPDVVAAVRELKPGVIRFGGSALEGGELGDLEWKDLIGSVEQRKPFRAWGGLQPRAAGMEEFVQFCEAVEAQPLMCVRFSKRTPKDAADQVEYFNSAVETPMGALRAKNGRAKPYKIKLWQIGNEVTGPDYEGKVADFARAMKAADPSIQLLASFPSPAVIKKAGDLIDFVAPHHYTRDLAGMERSLLDIRKMIADNAPAGRADKIKIAVTEWNVTAGDWGLGRSMLWSLDNALACSRYHNLLHRHADIVTIANRSNLANSFCSGILQTDRRSRLYRTPTFYAQQLYANFAGNKPLKLAGDAGALDVSATLSSDGRRLTLFVVNPTLKPIPATIDAANFTNDARNIAVQTLADRSDRGMPDVANSFDQSDVAVQPSDVSLPSGGKLAYQFPRLSLTVLRF